MDIPSYSKVYPIGHPRIIDIFENEVIVEEKIDGSQFSFGLFNGEMFCRSHNKQIDMNNVDNMFKTAVDNASEICRFIEDGTIIRCEYLKTPKHNTIEYNRVPKNNLIVFDIELLYSPMNYYEKLSYCEKIGLECVPILYKGIINDVLDVTGLLNRPSILGGSEVEGIVFKNYRKFTEDKKYYVGKYVSEKFKETHKVEWKKSNPSTKDVIENLCEEMRSDARWKKSIQHLNECGLLTGDLSDIPVIIKSIVKDIEEDESEYIKDKLFKYAFDKIKNRPRVGSQSFTRIILWKNHLNMELIMRFNDCIINLISIEFYKNPFEISVAFFEDETTAGSLIGFFFTREIGLISLFYHEFILWEK